MFVNELIYLELGCISKSIDMIVLGLKLCKSVSFKGIQVTYNLWKIDDANCKAGKVSQNGNSKGRLNDEIPK